VQWRWNGIDINRNFNIHNRSISVFNGGGETIVGNGSCERQMYRVALLVNGYLPGVYSYEVISNIPSQQTYTSPELTVEGKEC